MTDSATAKSLKAVQMPAVLLVLPPQPTLGGATRRLMTLAAGLSELGVDVRVCGYASDDISACCAQMDLSFLGQPMPSDMHLPALHGIWSKVLYVCRLLLGHSPYGRGVHESLRAARFAPDIVIARNALGVLAVRRIARGLRALLIWDVGIETRRPLRSLLFLFAAWRTQAIILQSRRQRDLIFGRIVGSLLRSRIHAITPGVMPPVGHSAKVTDRETIGFTLLQPASLCSRKNQRMSIEAFARCVSQPGFPASVRLAFAGAEEEPGYRDELVRLSKSLGVADRVDFLGWCADIDRVMQGADLVLLPSQDEGVPNVVQDAMWLGVPVAASKVGGVPELLENGRTGWLFEPGDTAALVDIILSAVRDPLARFAVSRAAQQHAESNFSVDVWARSYLKCIAESRGADVVSWQVNR